MKKKALIFAIMLPMIIAAMPIQLVFAEENLSVAEETTTGNKPETFNTEKLVDGSYSVFRGGSKTGVLGDVLSYTVYEKGDIVVEASESLEAPIYAMVASYEDGKMAAMAMVELSAGDEETMVLQDWGQEVKVFAVSKGYVPLSGEVSVWSEGEVFLDTSVLQSRIKEAEILLDEDYLISEDGSNITQDEQWITAEMKENLENAMYAAIEGIDNKEYETQAQVDEAVANLEAAIATFKPAYGTAAINLSELESRVKEAKNLLSVDYLISEDGSDITQDKQWITAEMKENLENAMYAAIEGIDNKEYETQAQVDEAAVVLEAAIAAFKPAYGIADFDTFELVSRIEEAKNLLDGDYQISADGSNIAQDKQWITAEMKENLENAMYAAEEAFYNEEFETQEQVDNAVKGLEDVIEAFKPVYGNLGKTV